MRILGDVSEKGELSLYLIKGHRVDGGKKCVIFLPKHVPTVRTWRREKHIDEGPASLSRHGAANILFLSSTKKGKQVPRRGKEKHCHHNKQLGARKIKVARNRDDDGTERIPLGHRTISLNDFIKLSPNNK